MNQTLTQIVDKEQFNLQSKTMTKNKRFRHNDFQVGDQVTCQDSKTGKWILPGTITKLVKSQDLNSRSFAVKLANGRILWRSSQFIKLDLTKLKEEQKVPASTNIIQSIKIISNW